MRLNTNLASLNVYRNYIGTLEEYSTSISKISSGNNISSAKDDPNKLAQSDRIKLQVRSLEMASRNIQDAVSMIQSADGAMNSVNSNLQRIRELAIQSGSGALNKKEKNIVTEEIKSLIESIDSLSKNADFNGVNLIGDTSVTDNSEPRQINVTVGGNIGENAGLDSYNLTAKGLGLVDDAGAIKINIDDLSNTIGIVDGAIKTVLSASSRNGAKQNRFESMQKGLVEMRDRNLGVMSKITDANVAFRSIELAKANLLINTSAAIMKQTNNFPNEILRILENIR